MEKPLQSIINRGFRKQMDLLFGEGSKVKITQVVYSTNDKSVAIHLKLLVSDVKLTEESYPDGLDMLINEAWEMFNVKAKIRLVHSLDLI